MTKEIEFLDSGEVNLVIDKEYHLPRPKFGQKNKIQQRIAEVAKQVETITEAAQEKAKGFVPEDVDENAELEDLDLPQINALLVDLDKQIFETLVDVWVEVVKVLSGNKPLQKDGETDYDEAPLWMGSFEIINELATHWVTNPLVSSPGRPTLTTVQ